MNRLLLIAWVTSTAFESEILWPNGKTQAVEDVELNRSLTVRFRSQP